MTTEQQTAVDVLVEALEKIRDYETPHHFPTEEEHAEYMACPECTRRRTNPFFPGNYCDPHFRVMVMKYERLNDDERKYNTSHNMRDIARDALSRISTSEGESRGG